MSYSEKRRHVRVKSQNLLSYVCLDEDHRVLCHRMGKTLNVAEGGILLETHDPINTKQTLEMTIGLRDETIDIRGKIVHYKIDEDEKYHLGIQFIDMDDNRLRILKKFIKDFYGQKDTLEPTGSGSKGEQHDTR